LERQFGVIFDRDETNGRSRHVGCAPKSGSKISALATAAMNLLRVDGIDQRVIQAPKPEPSHALRELTD
jgi:hypothetical protein